MSGTGAHAFKFRASARCIAAALCWWRDRGRAVDEWRRQVAAGRQEGVGADSLKTATKWSRLRPMGSSAEGGKGSLPHRPLE